MLSYQEALDIVLQNVSVLPSQEVGLYDALGKILAAPAYSKLDLPPADNSAMDGYACITAGLNAGDTLSVVDFLPAGKCPDAPLQPGQAIKIMTGAPIPLGCDAVIPIEDVENCPQGIRLNHILKPGSHIRRRAEDLQQGCLLAQPGTQLRAEDMAVLAAGGVTTVQVHPTPKVAILATGDELVELGHQPGPGQIINSNFHLLSAKLRLAGAEVIPLGIAKDTAGDLQDRIQRGFQADMLITTGGVSVGDHDLVQETLLEMGFHKHFWKVNIKPGKPLLFGTFQNKPVFGLPGNPASSALTFELFVRPALRALAGSPTPEIKRRRAVLSTSVQGKLKRQLFLWGTLKDDDGGPVFHPSMQQGSGQNRSFQGANALLPVPLGTDKVEASSEVEVIPLAAF